MYSRSAKGGEKGDPNRNPWLAKLVLYIPSKSRDLADENNKILTEWKWFETTVLKGHINMQAWKGYEDNLAGICWRHHKKLFSNFQKVGIK